MKGCSTRTECGFHARRPSMPRDRQPERREHTVAHRTGVDGSRRLDACPGTSVDAVAKHNRGRRARSEDQRKGDGQEAPEKRHRLVIGAGSISRHSRPFQCSVPQPHPPLTTSNRRCPTLVRFVTRCGRLSESLREQARRRHSNQAPFAERPRCYFLPDEPGEIRASVDRLVSAVPLSSHICDVLGAPHRGDRHADARTCAVRSHDDRSPHRAPRAQGALPSTPYQFVKSASPSSASARSDGAVATLAARAGGPIAAALHITSALVRDPQKERGRSTPRRCRSPPIHRRCWIRSPTSSSRCSAASSRHAHSSSRP